MTSDSASGPPAVGTVTTDNAMKKLSKQLAAVAQLNADIEFESQVYSHSAAGEGKAAKLPEKLQHWLDVLPENLKKITVMMPDVDSYSVQVGFPVGVSVSVTFKAHRDGTRAAARSVPS
jgi:hypothetical protein